MTGRLLFYFIGYGVAVKRIARIATIAAIAKIVKRENRPEIQITRLPDYPILAITNSSNVTFGIVGTLKVKASP